MGRLSGKIAFVTGAGGGIGRAIAFAMAREGAKVALVDINKDLLVEAVNAANGLDVVPVHCDVSDRNDVFQKLERFAADAGGLDILVNNAVIFHYALLDGFDPEIADHMLNVGLKGTFWCLQAATPLLKARGGGAVVNLSSVTVSIAFSTTSVYSAVKGAVDALTRQQAAELGQYGIRVNAIAPGTVATPGTESVIDAEGWKSREQKSLLNRLATAEDIGHAAVFLASEEARSITGVTLKVDAGMTITGP